MKLLSPLSSQAYTFRLGSIAQKLNQGLSLKVFGVVGCGKTSVFTWLVNNPTIQSLLSFSSNTKMFYIDLGNYPDPTFKKHTLILLKTYFSSFNFNQNKMILVIDSASSLFINQEIQLFLSQKYSIYRPNLTFIYLFSSYYSLSHLAQKASLLKTSLFENTYNFILFDQAETDFTIDQWQQILQVKYPTKTRRLIHLYSGGYPTLIKHFSILYKDKKNEQVSIKSADINSIFNRLYTSLSKRQKQTLISLSKNVKISRSNRSFDVLSQLGIVKPDHSFFSPLFSQFLLQQQKPKYQVFDLNFTGELTSSEYGFLDLLFNYKGQIVSRDQVAQTIWSHLWQEKYSDWAIDKLVSQLRKKLCHPQDKHKIITVRGRGFKLT